MEVHEASRRWSDMAAVRIEARRTDTKLFALSLVVRACARPRWLALPRRQGSPRSTSLADCDPTSVDVVTISAGGPHAWASSAAAPATRVDHPVRVPIWASSRELLTLFMIANIGTHVASREALLTRQTLSTRKLSACSSVGVPFRSLTGPVSNDLEHVAGRHWPVSV